MSRTLTWVLGWPLLVIINDVAYYGFPAREAMVAVHGLHDYQTAALLEFFIWVVVAVVCAIAGRGKL